MKKWMLGAALLLASVVYADEPQRVDISAAKAQMKVLTDGKGHFVAVFPYATRDQLPEVSPSDMLFYSADGKKFYNLPVRNAGADREEWEYTFWEPRVGLDTYQANLSYRKSVYTLRCLDRFTALTEGDRGLLDSGEFLGPRWTRRPFFLARDDRGTYYYVDRASGGGNKNFRVWSGQKGKMKLTKLKNVVLDSNGMIFATKKGDLRLIATAKDTAVFDDAVWAKGRKKTPLTFLPTDVNGALIFDDLGVYNGKPLGTPCDDL